jgi:hypothetical protein
VKKAVALGLAGIIIVGMVYTHPAFAHNFGGDESAAWLAKMAEIKTEASLVAKHVGDNTAIDYYSDALGEYWNSNDTREMGERNTLLAQEIPSMINQTLSDARTAVNQNAVNDDITKLSGYLDESVPVRVDKDKLDNSTIQALAVTYVLKEALEKYGDAINSTTDLNDMSQMNMNGMSSGSMMMTSTVVDQNKYENSIGLASAAQIMFNNVSAKNPDKSDANAKISDAFTKLLQDLNGKSDGNTIMMDVHTGIHPPLIDAYSLPLSSHSDQNPGSAVPEFPLPILLSIVAVTGVVIITRLKGSLR